MKKLLKRALKIEYGETHYIFSIFGKRFRKYSSKVANRYLRKNGKSQKERIQFLEKEVESLKAQVERSATAIGESFLEHSEEARKQQDKGIRLLEQKLITVEKHLQNSFVDTKAHIESLSKNSYAHFSAYSIANAGDNILVKSIRDSIQEVTEISISWAQRSIRKELNDEAVALVNKTNGLFVGGGGLFLRDTNPNEISGWQWPASRNQLRKIKVPIYYLALGYNRFRGQEDFEDIFTENINHVVAQSSFFGMRNHGSVDAIRKYLRDDLKEKVSFHPCATTVLSKLYDLPFKRKEKPFIAVNCAFDREDMRFGDKKAEVFSALSRLLKKLSTDYTIKCYSHMAMDEKAFEYFDDFGLEFERVPLYKNLSTDTFLNVYSSPKLVLAMRGHAQLIPFGCGTPTLSIITHDKLAWFLEDVGHPEWGVDVQDDNFELNLIERTGYILKNHKKVVSEIEAAKDRLWSTTMGNLQSLGLVDRRK